MEIIFIRHGKTAGNLRKCYIGTLDEPLCDEGVNYLRLHDYPKCDKVISSPMRRCIETAEIIYPDKKPVVYSDLRECSFGRFEGKNYIELSSDLEYRKWVESGGILPFPEGENPENFKRRCTEAFSRAVSENMLCGSLAFVVHGGTIMSVFEKYSASGGSFYDFRVENGRGFITDFYDGMLHIISEIL